MAGINLKGSMVTAWLLRPLRRIESLRADVATRRADIEALKQKAEDWKSHADLWKQNAGRWRQKAGRWEQNAGRWKQNTGRKSRNVLSTHVLLQIVESRAQTLPARAAIPSREQREAILREVSSAFVAATKEGPSVWGDRAHAMRVLGLNWWMPMIRPQPGGPSAAWLAKQRFPYRALTQTRELAIGGVMLDIGANIGRMSISRVVMGDVVAAYCAEPDPLNYACLVGNIVDNDLNGLLLPDRLAIADRDGTVILRRRGASGGHRIMADHGSVPDTSPGSSGPSSEDGEFVEVPCLTINTWMSRLRVDLDAVTFVKVDVQGAEMRVLQGASALLAKRHCAWQLELDPALLAAAGTSLEEVCTKVQQHFTHFIDMNGDIGGPRQRAISELPQSLAYLDGPSGKTDVLLYCSPR